MTTLFLMQCPPLDGKSDLRASILSFFRSSSQISSPPTTPTVGSDPDPNRQVLVSDPAHRNLEASGKPPAGVWVPRGLEKLSDLGSVL